MFLKKLSEKVAVKMAPYLFSARNLWLSEDQLKIAQIISETRQKCEKIIVEEREYWVFKSKNFDKDKPVILEFGGLFMNPTGFDYLSDDINFLSLHLPYEDFRPSADDLGGLEDYITGFIKGMKLKIFAVITNSIGDTILFELLKNPENKQYFQDLKKIVSLGGSSGGDTINLSRSFDKKSVSKDLVFSPNIEEALSIMKKLGIVENSIEIEGKLIFSLFSHIYGIDFLRADYRKKDTYWKIKSRLSNLMRYGVIAKRSLGLEDYKLIEKLYPEIEVLNLNGEFDVVTTPTSGLVKTEKQKKFLKATFKMLPNVGHSPFEGKGVIKREIVDFLMNK